ncbi:BON domain-containing protein [Vibrio sp. ZSDE26]|uniref:BON domain-containing protein n=1 Tax=Vibrio amylolyticus TaxID=2847292 RepID=A0A9X1XSN5_9VIBR|nr:BON domain-containing protein [Vibrio amylolyticus]MCK6264804.1 BON domain-containing protein [Vibrio amylolyticus]
MKTFRNLVLILTFAILSGCASFSDPETTATDTRSTKERWSDSNIEFEVAGLGNKAPFRGQVRVTASSYNGIVVLMGQSKTDHELNTFLEQANSIKGVNKVHNQVRIREPLSVTSMSSDSWITTKVKSALLTNSDLKGVNVKVITEDKEVFLLGYVSEYHADIATEVARNVSGVKQVIRAFQIGN